MRTQGWPKNRAEVESLEREQFMKDEADRERRDSDEYESMRDYADRMRREAEWDEEQA